VEDGARDYDPKGSYLSRPEMTKVFSGP
jgi:hypothetical protein